MNKIQNSASVFTWDGYDIHQRESVHKIGTDAILLGSWIPQILNPPISIADIGTGTGILSLMMAKAYPKATIHATDISEEALALAHLNMHNAGYGNRISVIKENVLQSGSKGRKFALVLSNPPYYSTHNPPDNEIKKQSKHINGPVSDWMHGFLERVADNGDCCIIVPSNAVEDWIRAANDMQFYNTQRLDVYSYAKDQLPVRSLLHFSKDLKKPVFTRLTLYDSANTYSLQYLELSGIVKEIK